MYLDTLRSLVFAVTTKVHAYISLSGQQRVITTQRNDPPPKTLAFLDSWSLDSGGKQHLHHAKKVFGDVNRIDDLGRVGREDRLRVVLVASIAQGRNIANSFKVDEASPNLC